MLRGLSWRSFTQRRPSQQMMAQPPGMHHRQMQQPSSSAQVTPRVQPSMLPTPRLGPGGPAPSLPLLADGSSRRLTPQQTLPGPTAIASALKRAASEAAAAEGSEPQDAAANGMPAEPAAAGSEEDPTALTSWRSDAVQLPEQQLPPGSMPSSPTAGGADISSSVSQRARGRHVGLDVGSCVEGWQLAFFAWR